MNLHSFLCYKNFDFGFRLSSLCALSGYLDSCQILPLDVGITLELHVRINNLT